MRRAPVQAGRAKLEARLEQRKLTCLCPSACSQGLELAGAGSRPISSRSQRPRSRPWQVQQCLPCSIRLVLRYEAQAVQRPSWIAIRMTSIFFQGDAHPTVHQAIHPLLSPSKLATHYLAYLSVDRMDIKGHDRHSHFHVLLLVSRSHAALSVVDWPSFA